MNHQQATSDGATSTPRGSVATLLSFIAPGLGLVYTGRLMAGLVINLLVVLFVLLFVIVATLFQFFPIYAAFVLGAAGLLSCALSAWRSVELIRSGEARRGRSFQHPLIYVLVAIATFVAPLAMTAHFTERHLMTMTPVDDLAMVPQLERGDHLIVDRTVYRDRAPQRGDVVTIRIPDTDELTTLRVVGLPDEQVTMDGFVLRVGDDSAHYTPLEPEAVNTAVLGDRDPGEMWVEHLGDQRHVITSFAGAAPEGQNARYQLGDDEYFLLADNRQSTDDDGESTHVDSRHFGAVDAGHIEGRPLYVGWSTSSNAGEVRWERLGLPIH